jgi:suppressor of cytokine signaling 5
VDVDNVNNVNVVHTIVEYRHVFVPDMAAVLAAPYYWGAIDRWEAEALLDGAADGFFLRENLKIFEKYKYTIKF